MEAKLSLLFFVNHIRRCLFLTMNLEKFESLTILLYKNSL